MSEIVTVDVRDDGVGIIEMRRPPHNFLSPTLVETIADALEAFDGDPAVRAAVLAAEGRSFCAGADLGGEGPRDVADVRPTSASVTARLYEGAGAALRRRHTRGRGGPWARCRRRSGPRLDRFDAGHLRRGAFQRQLRQAGHPSRFRVERHAAGAGRPQPGRAGAVHRAAVQRRGGDPGSAWLTSVFPRSWSGPAPSTWRARSAENAPLAVQAMNRTLRAGLADRVRAATAHEAAEQARLGATMTPARGCSPSPSDARAASRGDREGNEDAHPEVRPLLPARRGG